MSPLRFSLLAGLLLAPPSFAQFKNLQVLPKNISKDELKSVMRAQAKALGQECDFCHKMPMPEVETEKKKIAREMMKMTNEINAKFMKKSKLKVNCDTCHRGKEEPEVGSK